MCPRVQVYQACFSDAAKNKVYSAIDKDQQYGEKEFEVASL